MLVPARVGEIVFSVDVDKALNVPEELKPVRIPG
jgi:hypothetical protein